MPKPQMPTRLIRCKSIKFRATFPKAESYGLHQVKEVVFGLGLGPCGKHVLRLEYEINDDLMTIVQTSRHPDDLEEPLVVEFKSIQEQLKTHDRALRMIRDAIRDAPRTITTGHLWWKREHTVKVNVSQIMGKLENDQVAALQFRQSEIRKESQAWLDRLEVKTFTYKMSDVHGRVEAIQ